MIHISFNYNFIKMYMKFIIKTKYSNYEYSL